MMIALIGDSIIAGFPSGLPAPFGSMTNLGASGESSTQIAARIGAVPAGTTCLVIEGGINNFLLGTSGAIVADYRTMLEAQPAVRRVLVLGILPVDEAAGSPVTQSAIDPVNSALVALCDEFPNAIPCIDPVNVIGRTVDGVHWQASVYSDLVAALGSLAEDALASVSKSDVGDGSVIITSYVSRAFKPATVASPGCAAAAAFLARVPSLDAELRTPYADFICGLVEDGVWSRLDLIYAIFTKEAAHSLLNLKQDAYNGVAHGSPVFTPFAGYRGIDGSTTVYIDTGLNPMVNGVNYSQDSAHVAVWNNTNAGASSSGGVVIGCGGFKTNIFPKWSDGKAYFRINDGAAPSSGIPVTDASGMLLANRSGPSVQQGYRNGVNLGIVPVASGPCPNSNVLLLAWDISAPNFAYGGGYQLGMASVGSSLSPSLAAAHFNRFAVFRAALEAA